MMSFKYQFLSLVALLFGVAVFASPAPAPVADAEAVQLVGAALKMLDSRQIDLGGIIGQIGGIIPALLQLLNAQTINTIGGLVNNAGALLAPPFVNQTRALINTVSGLLNGLQPLLDLLSGLLTPELINKVGGLLDALFSLITPQFINTISSLINDLAPVSPNSGAYVPSSPIVISLPEITAPTTPWDYSNSGSGGSGSGGSGGSAIDLGPNGDWGFGHGSPVTYTPPAVDSDGAAATSVVGSGDASVGSGSAGAPVVETSGASSQHHSLFPAFLFGSHPDTTTIASSLAVSLFTVLVANL
jgi:hypothetical protein